MEKKNLTLPVFFTVKDKFTSDDMRFTSVYIDVMHTGLNFNGSIFNKSVVDENVETIKNTPILGFIAVNSDNEKDFKGHEYIISKIDRDGVARKYVGSAYGVIPESCNPRWVNKVCDDGEEREFLRVDGLIWTKFSDANEILLRDIEKSHSMELFPDSIEGYEDEDGNFVFTKFSFDGCCILGKNVEPAMQNSIVEVQFTMSDFVRSIQGELNECCNTFSKIINSEKGGINDMENQDFTMSVLQQFDNIAAIVKEHDKIKDWWGDEVPRYYLQDIQDNEIIVVDRANNYQYYSFTFSMNGDDPVIDFESCKRKKIVYEDYEDGANAQAFVFEAIAEELKEKAFSKIEDAENAVEAANNEKATIEADYTTIKNDYDEIKPKYDAYVIAEQEKINQEIESKKDQMFNEYENMFAEHKELIAEGSDFALLKAKKADLSVEEIEKECALIYVRANRRGDFSKKVNDSGVVGVVEEANDSGSFVNTKYGNIAVNR